MYAFFYWFTWRGCCVCVLSWKSFHVTCISWYYRKVCSLQSLGVPWKLQSPDFHFLLPGVPGRRAVSCLLHARQNQPDFYTPLHPPRCTFFPKCPPRTPPYYYWLEGISVVLQLLGHRALRGRNWQPDRAILLNHAIFNSMVCLLDRCIRSSPLIWPWQSQMPYKSYFDLKQVSILVKHKALRIKNMPNQNSDISDYVFQDGCIQTKC